MLRETVPENTDIRYTGQLRETGTGLYNYKARMCDPEPGKFLATAPAIDLRRLAS